MKSEYENKLAGDVIEINDKKKRNMVETCVWKQIRQKPMILGFTTLTVLTTC